MVSVIIPVYQAIKTLDRCVQSILAQTYRDYELLLIDDGSTDGSAGLCDSYSDERIRVIHGPNRGAAAARNSGISASSGEWICFVDSDDIIAPDFLETLISVSSDSGADIVSCGYLKCVESELSDISGLFSLKTKNRQTAKIYDGHAGTIALLYQKGFISAPWGMISRRSLWSDLSFPVGTAAEDMGTIYRLFLNASRIARTERILYGYVQSPGNTVFSTSSRRNPDYYSHSRKMLSYIRKHYPDCVRAAASRHLSTCFQILSETSPAAEASTDMALIDRVYSDIRSVRSTVIKDKYARPRNRGAAVLSYLCLPALHRLLHEKYIKSIPSPEDERIAMIEYQGRCDETGKAVGHAPRVLPEYYHLISENHPVEIYAPRTILQELPDDISGVCDLTPLSHHIIMKASPTLIERILNKYYMFSNIHRVLKHCNAEILWFYNVEFYFFLYLALFGNHKKRIVVTLFRDGYHKGRLAPLKQRIFESGQKKVRVCISTGRSFKFKNMRSVFIPDYVYDEKSYSEYAKCPKEDYTVVLGTMDRGKQLEDIISVYNRLTRKLIIAGRFYDKGWVKELKTLAGNNIEIRDEYLSREDYLSLLSHASFAAVPYDKDLYSFQTSGVMQEALFTDTIVITHKDILTGNGFPGIGYEKYDDITEQLLSDTRHNTELLKEYEYMRKNVYSRDSIRIRLDKVWNM
ncbi:MAG: glycosyltransferase [Lachnospiraceae bacterium]|nr:glycosyltransferase [Lachnospiraceae bacterium]